MNHGKPYAEGLRRVKTTPEPEGQKFKIGTLVRISKNCGTEMTHFINGMWAFVEYTYGHAYQGKDVKMYSLMVNYGPGQWTSNSWYFEDQLTEVTDPETIRVVKGAYEHALAEEAEIDAEMEARADESYREAKSDYEEKEK